jgi:hypothetical protein
MAMKRFAAGLAAALLFGTAVCTAANVATVAVMVKLPSGAPAKHAFVRMWKMGANYAIVSLETETTNASGSAIFKVRSGACLKAEYGDDGAGRPRYIGSACPTPYEKTVTINLSP